MKFLKALTQKKLAKAVVCGLVVSGGVVVGMGQAFAAPPAPPAEGTAFITGAEFKSGMWIGDADKEIKVTAAGPEGHKNYSTGTIYGNDAGSNIVTIEGGTVNDYVYGSYMGDNNTVNISGGTVNGNVYGGSVMGDGSTVNISGGTVNGNVFGAETYGNNTVNISGGIVNGNVIGSGGAAGNTINISGGNVKNVYSNGSWGDNDTINISGGTIEGFVNIEYGSNHTVNIIGIGGEFNGIKNNGEIKIDGEIKGSDATLNVAGTGTQVGGITGIKNMNFYIPASAENGSTMLTVTGDKNVALKGVTIKAGVDGNNKNLKVNDAVKLIVADKAMIKDFDPSKAGKLDVDGFATFGLTIEQPEENVLQATITESPNKGDDPINPEAKSPVETRVAVATILNTGADMLATAGFDNAASAVASEVKAGGSASSMTPFVAVGGTKAKVKSGSHIDVKGWNINLGLAKEIDNKAGKLLIGPVVEYGRGSYDSYVNDVHGEGDSHFWGVGVMAKQTNNNGFYYEGSLRAGKASSDYQNKAVAGHSYDSDAAYWAAHVGVGKIVKLGDKDNLDYYGKFFYSHQKGDDVTTKSGTDLHFDATKSVRTRLGMRLNHEMDTKNALYAGLAWQREFDGDATATITVLGNNYSTPAPSIKGNTGIMELGWKVNANKNLDLDLGATGYTGKQKGASLNLALNFKF